MYKIIIVFLSICNILNSYSQTIPFSIGDTSTYKTVYKTSTQLSEFKFPSYSESISKIVLQSINKSDSSLTFLWICKEYKNTATDSGSELSKAIVETVINFPVLFSVNKNGSITIKGDNAECKTRYITKFNSIAKRIKLNNEYDGLRGYLSLLSSTSFSDILFKFNNQS